MCSGYAKGAEIAGMERKNMIRRAKAGRLVVCEVEWGGWSGSIDC